jgi:hypothetical protein
MANANRNQGSKLGKLIFEREHKTALGTKLLVAFFFGIMTIGGLRMTFTLFNKEEPARGIVGAMGFGFFLTGSAGLYFGLTRKGTLFRFCEFGAQVKGKNGVKKLLYDDLESFIYKETKNYIEDTVHVSTTIELTLTSKYDEEPIYYFINVHRNDQELEDLRDYLALMIRDRMQAKLEKDTPVPLFRNYEFRTKGLYSPKKTTTLLSSEGGVIPYRNLNLKPDKGGFVLLNSENKQVGYWGSANENFFPALLLLIDLVEGKVRLKTNLSKQRQEECDVDFT